MVDMRVKIIAAAFLGLGALLAGCGGTAQDYTFGNVRLVVHSNERDLVVELDPSPTSDKEHPLPVLFEYPAGTMVQIKAPLSSGKLQFMGWKEGSSIVSTNPTLSRTLTRGTKVQAVYGDPTKSGNYAHLLQVKYWPDRPITAAFAKDNHHSDALQQMAQDAMDAWVEGMDGKISFSVVESLSQAKLRVYFLPQVVSDNPNVLGLCIAFYQEDALIEADVYIDSNEPESVIRKIALHEFGHALGLLGGHSDSSDDIMYPAITSTGTLSRRDLNTLGVAYDGRSRTRIDPNAPIRREVIAIMRDGTCVHY
jgi:hypothetical protein